MSQRTEQVAATLQKILGEVMTREVELPMDHLVTISRIDVNPDLKNAKVYLSILPFESAHDVMPIIRKQKNHIQQEVHKNIEMKYSPVLEFILDTKPEEADEMERLIDKEMELFDL